MSKLITFSFTGTGRYDLAHGWDDGLKVKITEVGVAYPAALADQAKTRTRLNRSFGLPVTPRRGVYYILDEHDGSRKVWGYVVARGLRDAHNLIEGLRGKFPVSDFIKPDDGGGYHRSDS